MTVAARRVLVEYNDITEATTTLTAVISRREYVRERIRNLLPNHLDGWSRELQRVEAAEASLRRALNEPAEWTEAENREAWGR